MSDERAGNIREAVQDILGMRVVEVTASDWEDCAEDGSYVCLHFENGVTVTFPISDDGFDINYSN